MNIDKYSVSLKELIDHDDKFYAHSEGNRVETINEHIELCIKYLKRIVSVKNIDGIITKIIQSNQNLQAESSEELFIELFINTIVFHDIGKINPKFQIDKMHNDHLKDIASEKNYQSRHSLLSAYIYIAYYNEKLKDLPKNIKFTMMIYMYLNAFVISRHHSQINDLKSNFINDMIDENEINLNLIQWFNENLLKLLKQQNEVSLIKKRPWQKMECFLAKQSINNQINVYLYVRLLHSLLVTCDYLATSEFKNRKEIEINNYQFDEIIEAYNNNDLIKKIRENDVAKIEGINRLRTEIFLESERNLLNNLDKNIFYLEAPTGSGKSNTALNLSLQLVNKCENLNKIISDQYISKTLEYFKKKNVVKINDQYLSVFREVLKRILNRVNMYDLINLLLRQSIDSGESSYLAYYTNRIVEIQYIIKGGKSMGELYHARKDGWDLRNKLENVDENYRGTIYQLINALKVDDRNKFVDIILRIYTSKGLPIPFSISRVLESDYGTEIGYQFITGLKGAYESFEEKENKDDE